MNKTIFIIGMMLLTLIAAASAHHDPTVSHNPVYGVLPQEGIFYARKPIYHTTAPLGYSSVYGFGFPNIGFSHSFRSFEAYGHQEITNHFGHPGYYPGIGFYGVNHDTVIHHQHRPVLYPGIYRTHPIY